MLKKYVSKKLFVLILTVALDYLVSTGQLTPELKELLLKLLTSLGGTYIIAQSIIDTVKTGKSE